MTYDNFQILPANRTYYLDEKLYATKRNFNRGWRNEVENNIVL